MQTETLTARKRWTRPHIFRKRDARTRVYRALYGHPSKPDPQGDPALNEFRSGGSNYAEAVVVYDTFRLMAQFTEQREAQLLRRLETLRGAPK